MWIWADKREPDETFMARELAITNQVAQFHIHNNYEVSSFLTDSLQMIIMQFVIFIIITLYRKITLSLKR